MLQGNLLNSSTSHKRKCLPNTVVPMWKRYSLLSCILARYSLSYSLSKETSTIRAAISFLPPTQTYQYKLHPTPLCRTKAGIRGWCRCGTATWTQCLCRQLGLACGSIWPAEGSREGRRETDVKASGIMCSLSGKFRALCSINVWHLHLPNDRLHKMDKWWFLVNKVRKCFSKPKCLFQRCNMES